MKNMMRNKSFNQLIKRRISIPSKGKRRAGMSLYGTSRTIIGRTKSFNNRGDYNNTSFSLLGNNMYEYRYGDFNYCSTIDNFYNKVNYDEDAKTIEMVAYDLSYYDY